MTDSTPPTGWALPPDLNRALRLKRIETCREQGKAEEVILEAEELLDLNPACSETLFYLGEALLQMGDAEGALQAFEQHKGLSDDIAPSVHMGLAMAHFECCQIQSAEQFARKAIHAAAHEAQAHYILGLVLELKDQALAESTGAFLAAHQLDPQHFPLPQSLSREAWKKCVEQALQRAPEKIRHFWDDLPVHLFESPALDELSSIDPPLSPRVLGMYLGSPSDGHRRPEGLRLFTRNLSRSRDTEEIVSKILSTLVDEALDWMGEE
jgi:tetratricopeptide (TPR) repeat protein